MIYDQEFLNKVKSESFVSNKVEKRNVSGKGIGLFAKEKISKGEIVSISGGVILNKNEWKDLLNEFDYSYNVSEDLVITPLNPKDPSDDWRMNHCCEPNCGVRGQTMFVAIVDIQKDSELTFDYAMTESDSNYEIELHCDKNTCRKKFSGNDWKERNIQIKYKGYFSTYLADKIENENKGN